MVNKLFHYKSVAVFTALLLIGLFSEASFAESQRCPARDEIMAEPGRFVARVSGVEWQSAREGDANIVGLISVVLWPTTPDPRSINEFTVRCTYSTAATSGPGELTMVLSDQSITAIHANPNPDPAIIWQTLYKTYYPYRRICESFADSASGQPAINLITPQNCPFELQDR